MPPAKRPPVSATDQPAALDTASLPGRFYAALAGLDDSGDSPQRYRRQAFGLMGDIVAHLQRRTADAAARAGIHPTDLIVLILLYRANAEHLARAALIQRSLGFTAGGVTRRLDAMEQRELVQRIPDPQDGRAWLVRLTSRGAAIAQEVLAAAVGRNQRLYDEFATDEWQGLVAQLSRFAAALE